MPDTESRSPRVTFPWLTERPADARTHLTRDQIVEAAVRLADTEGLEALSMRRLGQVLDAGATSLYWHVRSKDELLDLVVDRIIGEVRDEMRSTGSWRADLEETARSIRRVLVRHRHIAPVIGSRPTFGPHAVAALEWLIGRLRSAGTDVRTALLASQSVINYAAGFAVFECRDPLGIDSSEDDRRAFMEQLGRFVGTLPADQYPNTLETLEVGASITPDEQFEYGLRQVLNGIEADVTNVRTRGRGGRAAPAPTRRPHGRGPQTGPARRR